MKRIITLFLIACSALVQAQSNEIMTENSKPYTILVLMNATPQWLSLTRAERSKFVEKELSPILQTVVQTVEVRMFDSEYFHAAVSDFMVVTTTNLDDYKLLIEMLRDTKIYGAPYFEIKDIIVGQEELFVDFNEKLKK